MSADSVTDIRESELNHGGSASLLSGELMPTFTLLVEAGTIVSTMGQRRALDCYLLRPRKLPKRRCNLCLCTRTLQYLSVTKRRGKRANQ